MTHDQFYTLTVREYVELLDGYKVRDEIYFRFLGWQTANLMNCHARKGRRVTVDKLCGKPQHSLEAERRATGKFFLEGEEHERIKEYFKNARSRKLESASRSGDEAIQPRVEKRL